MLRHNGAPNEQSKDIVVLLGTPHARSVGCLRIVMIFAGIFFIGMIVVGERSSYQGSELLMLLGAMALFATGLGWFVLNKAGPSKLIVSASAVTLCRYARTQRIIAYRKIKSVNLQTKILTHKFGRRTAVEEIHFLVFRLRSGKSIKMLAPDEHAGNQAIQMVQPHLASISGPRKHRDAIIR